ncbi:MAG: lysophospholipid acyltransferase family protein [Pseudomonadota bacterium]
MAKRGLWSKLFVSREFGELIDAAPKPSGTLDYDPWGFNYEATKTAFGAFRLIYEKYFRVKAHGLEHVPASGRCLIIGNHSGQLPIDGILVGYALATNPFGPRIPRTMIERFFPSVPFLGNALNQVGAVVGEPANCRKMLESDEAIIVFPEGVRGSGKPYRKRYQLQRFGNGFMHLAIDHRTPIIPVGIVGCEETIPALGSITPLARMLGLPYLPIAFPFPLPARVILNFGAPMHFGHANSEAEITANVDAVKRALEELITKGLDERKSIF